jgi:hypothetical protein
LNFLIIYGLRELFYISPPSRPGMPPRSRPVFYIPKKWAVPTTQDATKLKRVRAEKKLIFVARFYRILVKSSTTRIQSQTKDVPPGHEEKQKKIRKSLDYMAALC